MMINFSAAGRWRNPSEVILDFQVRSRLALRLCSVVLICVISLGITTLLLWPLILLFGSYLKVPYCMRTVFFLVDFTLIGPCVRERSPAPKKKKHTRGPNGSLEQTIFAGLMASSYLLSWTRRGHDDI